jgi:hypothetical protein
MKTTVALLCVCLFVSLPAQAQQATAKAPAQNTTNAGTSGAPAAVSGPAVVIDRAKEEDIRTLLELAGTKARMTQVMTDMEKSMKPLMISAFPKGEYRGKLIEAFFVKFHSKLDLQPLLDQAVLAYDRHYSHEEIKELIQFYQTPVGKKLAEVGPQITTELMAQGQKFGQELGRTSMQEVLTEHPDLEKQMEEAQRSVQPH